MVTEIVDLDLGSNSSFKILTMEGDICSRFIEFHLSYNGEVFNLQNKSVKCRYVNGKTTEEVNLVINDRANGVCTLEIPYRITSIVQNGKCELVISQSGEILSTIPFGVEVVKSLVKRAIVESSSEFGALNDALWKIDGVDSRLNNINSQLDKKMNKTDKIKGSQLDTSSDSVKLGINNLSEEAIQSLSRPLQLRMGNGDFQIGYDVAGSIITSNDKVVCNTNLLNVEKDRCIKIETSFSYRVLISYYKDNTFVRRDDFIDYKNNKFDLVGNDFNQIRLSFQKYPNDTEAINLLSDVIKVYVGYSTMIAEIKDNSITREKYADDSINNRKLQEPITRLIPWTPFSILKKVGSTVTIKFAWNSVISFTTGKYTRIDEDVEITLPDGHLLCLYCDTNQTGIVKAGNFEVEDVDVYEPRSDKHVLILNYANSLFSDIPIYHDYITSYLKGQNATSNTSNVLTVGKTGAMFDTINKAVDHAKTMANINNQFTILVYPGIYKEVVNLLGTAYISIVGINKVTCILRDDSGQYFNAPLRVEGNCFIHNMTIIATHDDDQVTPVDSLRAYAVHADDPGEGTAEFNNCVMISHQNAAFGSGLHSNVTLKLINCELYSYCPNESTMKDNGALFIHDGNNATNQKVIVKNCTVKSLFGKSMYLNGHYGTGLVASFYNNTFWCEETGKNSIRLDPPNGGISNNIKLTGDSYGNNVDVLNG